MPPTRKTALRLFVVTASICNNVVRRDRVRQRRLRQSPNVRPSAWAVVRLARIMHLPKWLCVVAASKKAQPRLRQAAPDGGEASLATSAPARSLSRVEPR